jgi:hypothetical protein
MPLAVYQITSSNNIIYFRENSTNKQATLNLGYYNAIDLADQAKTALNTASGGFSTFTVTYSSSTFKMIFGSTNSFTLQWGTFGGPYLAFGFKAVDAVSAGLGNTAVSTQAIQMSGPLGLNVSIREFDGTVWNGGLSLQGTFQFPLETGLGTISTFKPNPRELIQRFRNKTVKTLYIRVTDFAGNVIDINQQEWLMKIILYNKYDRHLSGNIDTNDPHAKDKKRKFEEIPDVLEEILEVLKKRK